jgi:SAM-dependent methyltransferase
MLQIAPMPTPAPARTTSDHSSAQTLPSCAACGGRLAPRVLLCGPDRLLATPGLFCVRVCERCAGAVTFPTVSPQELSAYYPTAYAPYEPAVGRAQRLVSAIVQRVQRRSALRRPPLAELTRMPAGRALDVGCGRGDLGAMLVERGWEVTGVEPSEDACAVARARGVDARCGTLEDAGLEAGRFDVAIFQHSLEHVPDPVADLARCERSLRNGGLVLITVPNFGCWQRRRFRTRWFHLDLPRHRFHFNCDALARALERAGLEPVALTTSTSSIGLPASVQYAVFGRCLFPSGLPLRIAAGACIVSYPVTRLLDRVQGEGDLLHAVARKRSRS